MTETKKQHKKILIMTAVFSAICLIASLILLLNHIIKENKYGNTTPLILMYHLILDEPFNSDTDLFVKPSEFDRQLSILSEKGYSFLFASELNEEREPGKYVVITLDDGYEDNYTNMFPILKKYNAKATISVITDHIDTPGHLSSAQIKEMSDSGLVSIQTHTKSHPALSELTGNILESEMTESAKKLEEITGVPVTVVCYPYGKYNDEVLAIARENFKVGLSTEDAMSTSSSNIYCLPRIGIPYSCTEEDFLKVLERWENMRAWYLHGQFNR